MGVPEAPCGGKGALAAAPGRDFGVAVWCPPLPHLRQEERVQMGAERGLVVVALSLFFPP